MLQPRLMQQVGHVDNEASPIRASTHFNLDLLSRYLDMPLVEWHDLKHVGKWGQNTTAHQPQIFEEYRARSMR